MEKPKVLILAPCGIRVLAMLGAIRVLKEKHFLDEIDEYIGVSAGAIVSMYLACNIPIDEIISHIFSQNFIQEIELDNFFERRGFVSKERVSERLSAILPNRDIKFKDLDKSVTVVAFNITKMKPEYFNRTTTPDLSVVEAVSMSISIPLIFEEHKWNDCVYIDGGVGNNYPCELCNGRPGLGIRLETNFNHEKSTIENLMRLFSYVMADLEQKRQQLSEKMVHIVIRTDIEGSAVVHANDNKKIELIKVGCSAAEKWLSES